ncbi:hypothetical protein BKA59DRAFT_488115 [Fusarium tricinctum]|uniref:Uncharacterized protein n=1 Tax=Fusarium tricinctum TaxID=61284 RepID=A0A8K0RPN5_9HYPO|nr:hypothetical protein BKA59DRAFT_488115 [Fusarium tricinctum]
MKVYLVTVAALVASSFAAPVAEKPFTKRLSHIVETFSHNLPTSPDVDLHLQKDDDKEKRATAKTRRSESQMAAQQPHSKRLLADLGLTRFRNSDDLIAALGSLVNQITAHGVKINATLNAVQAGKTTKAKAKVDTTKEVMQMRTVLSGFLTRLASSRNLGFNDSEIEDIVDLLDKLILQIVGTVDSILGGLGSRDDITSPLNPLINMLTNLVSNLGVSDTELGAQLRELLGSILKGQVSGDKVGLNALLSGLESPLLRLHGLLGGIGKTN